MTEPKQTLGAYRVGVSFNPSGNYAVTHLKALAAEFIDLCSAGARTTGNEEQIRCYEVAMTEMETAAMWAVKAATKAPRS